MKSWPSLFLVIFPSMIIAAESPSKNLVTPIFSQIVMLPYPDGFTPVLDKVSGPQYIQESVLNGETKAAWSEMLTITGTKDIASAPGISPAFIATKMAQGFKKDCPTSFNAVSSGSFKVSGHDAFLAIIGCGTALPTGEPYSESVMVISIKGEKDYYTVQWAERGKASSTPPNLTDEKWTERLKKIMPIKLCPVIPNESAPYQSCIDKK